MIATNPSGWMPAERLAVPAYGGVFTLPSGVPAFAEALDRDGAFLVRRLEHAAAGRTGRRRPAAPARRRAPARDRRRSLGRARPPPGRDPRAAARAPARADHRAAGRRGLRRGREQQHGPRRGLAAAQAVGLAIETDPYRFVGHVESDLGRVRAPLLRGAVEEAADLYAGPLLPHSDSPGVERERQALEGWMRHAVMTGDDRDALWTWLQTPSGEDDPAGLEAVALGAGLPRSPPQPGRGAGREAAQRHALTGGICHEVRPAAHYASAMPEEAAVLPDAGASDLAAAAAALRSRLPEPLAALAAIAYNYRWSWTPGGPELFASIDARRWELCARQPRAAAAGGPPETLGARSPTDEPSSSGWPRSRQARGTPQSAARRAARRHAGAPGRLLLRRVRDPRLAAGLLRRPRRAGGRHPQGGLGPRGCRSSRSA